MAGSDGKVVFPVKFDLQSAVNEASGDIDKVLRRLQTMVNHRPLQMHIAIDEGRAGGTSIRAIRKRMSELVSEWDKMSNRVKYSDDTLRNYSATALAVIQEFATLTAATRTHAQSLSELQRASDKAVATEEKKMAAQQKAVAKSQQTVAMLKAEETSLTAVAAKMKFYQEIADRKGLGTSEYKYATEQLQRLGAQYERLKAIMNSNTGNGGKDTFGAERMKATLRGAENSIEGVKAKLCVLDRILSKTPQDSFGFRRASEEATRLMGVMKQLEANTPKSIAKEQEKLQKALIDEAAKRAEIYNKKRQQEAEDLAAQQKKAAEESRIKQESIAKEQQANEARKRILNEQRLSYDTLTQKIQMLEAARNKTDIGAARWQRLTNEINKAKESLKVITDEMDKTARRSERLARLREIFSMSEKSMAGLSARLQEYNSRLQRLDVGTAAFDRTAQKVAALSAELQRASQFAQDFAQKAFQGLNAGDTTKRVQELQYWRNELQRIDEAYNRLRNIQMTTGLNRSQEQAINNLLDHRRTVVEKIKQSTLTAEQAALEQERKISEEKRKQAALAQKQQARTSQKNLLASQSKDIDTLTKKLEYYRQLLNKLDPNTKPKAFTQIAKEVQSLTAELQKAQQNINKLTGVSNASSNKVRTNIKGVTQEYSKQLGYVERLIRRMMVYGSIGMVGNFLTKVREITAQFELQRVSLGAILQDQNKANQLFSEIKSFALKSPVSILDLTKYTKQLAAYKIGYDELFETTKKLTDVSVGLGVSMDRVVLAYGQVRATGHLRASEIRQFTEMGVPIVEELAAKLTKMNGELVTAAQVMDMVSKRGISFQMVKEVFDDMTSSGGIFYNMQEKQGNTLYGLWAKLGDAASVMYDEIGRTGPVNSAMKFLIESATSLMRNWKAAGIAGITLAAILGTMALRNKAASVGTQKKQLADAKAAAAEERRAVATQRRIAAEANGTPADIAAAKAAEAKAIADERAAHAEQRHAQSSGAVAMGLKSIGASIASFAGWTVVLTAISTLVYKLTEAWQASHRLKDSLDEISSETGVLQGQSVRKFEYLANTARDSANGSREQREALEELQRTYKDILPEESLKLENLRKMSRGYEELTAKIREYIAVQQREKGLNEISEKYGAEVTSASKSLIDEIASTMKVGRDVAAQIIGEMERDYREKLKKGEEDTRTITQRMIAAAKKAGVEMSEGQALSSSRPWWFSFGGNKNYLEDFYDALDGMESETRDWENRMNGMSGALLEFQQNIDKTKEKVKNIQLIDGNKQAVDKDSFLGQQMLANGTMKLVADLIKNDTEISDAIKNKEVEWNNDWIHLVSSVDKKNLMDITTINFDAIIEAFDKSQPLLADKIRAIQKEWGNVAPTNATVVQICQKLFNLTESFGLEMDKMGKYLWDGSGKVEEYLERLKDQQEELRKRLKEKEVALLHMGKDIEAGIAQMKKELKAIDQLVPYVTEYTVPKKDKNKGGSKSDTRLQTLQEINQTLTTINKEYDDLMKKEGKSKALEDIKKQFADTLAYTNKLGKKFGLHFDFPTEFTSLQQYRREILKVMETLKKLKGGEKAVLEFQTMIGKADSDEMQKQIERQLKDLADKISRTKVAKEFYDKILAQTGDVELATRVTYSIYPETGKDLYTEMQDQIRRIFDTGDKDKNAKLKLRLDSVFDDENERINYRELDKIYAEFQNDIIEKNRDTAQKLIAEGQKTAAANIATWEKELAKAKDYEEQRTDIIVKAAEERAKMLKEVRDPDEREKLVKLSHEKEAQDLAKVNFEEFTKSEDYIKIFENLDNTSTPALKRLREEMQKLIDTNTDLSPENMKTLVKAMEDIDNQISGRGFGNDMVQSVRDYVDALRDLKTARANLKAAQAEYDAQEPILDAEINAAKAEEIAAQQALNDLKASGLATENQIVSAELRLNTATANVAKAEQKKAKAADKVKKAEKEVTDQQDKQKKATSKFFKDLQQVAQTADQLASVLGDVKDILQVSEDSVTGLAFDAAIDSLQEFSKIMGVIIGLQTLYNIVTESNPWIAIAAAVLAVGAALGSFISANKVRKANKEIERQQEILDRLEYTYNRLQTAADKLFGTEYISNYNQQIKALQAEAEAYRKQAEAEKSKGKKTDKEKLKGYEESYRDTLDEIEDMTQSLVEKFTGSGRPDLARDFAQSWLEAKVAFESTTDAIESKYKEMIKNMIVEGAAAKVIDSILSPMWDQMDSMLAKNDIDGAIDYLVNGMDAFITQADNGMNVLWKALESRGYDMKTLLGETGNDVTGIARTIATASEESINGAAAAWNTNNFYASQQLMEVQRIRALLEAGANPGVVTGAEGTVDIMAIQNKAMGHLAAIERNTSETAAQCAAAANKCEEIAGYLRRATTAKGSKQGFNVFSNY